MNQLASLSASTLARRHEMPVKWGSKLVELISRALKLSAADVRSAVIRLK